MSFKEFKKHVENSRVSGVTKTKEECLESVKPTIHKLMEEWLYMTEEQIKERKEIIEDFGCFKLESKPSGVKDFLTIATTVPEDSSEKEIQEHIKKVEEDFEEKVRKELLNLLKK